MIGRKNVGRIFPPQVWPDRFQANGRPMPRCFIDRRGKKFTTEVVSSGPEWWREALILSRRDQMEDGDNGIPLIEVDPETGVPLGNGEVNKNEPHITCPLCRFTSYNRNDIREGYCGRCHWWTSHPMFKGVFPDER